MKDAARRSAQTGDNQAAAKPERLLSVVQVGLTVCSLALGWVGEIENGRSVDAEVG